MFSAITNYFISSTPKQRQSKNSAKHVMREDTKKSNIKGNNIIIIHDSKNILHYIDYDENLNIKQYLTELAENELKQKSDGDYNFIILESGDNIIISKKLNNVLISYDVVVNTFGYKIVTKKNL